MEENKNLPENPYNNELAFNEFVKMMRRKEKLTITIVLDKYSYEALEIESKRVDKFVLQTNSDIYDLIFDYLYSGKIREQLPSPTENLSCHSDKTNNDFAEFSLGIFLANDKQVEYHMHIVPEVIDKSDKITVTFRYKNGIIVIKAQRTDTVKELLASKGF